MHTYRICVWKARERGIKVVESKSNRTGDFEAYLDFLRAKQPLNGVPGSPDDCAHAAVL